MKKSKTGSHPTDNMLKNKMPFLNAVWYAVIPLLAFFLYSETLHFGYNGDDDTVTRGNLYVQQGINGIGKIFTSGYHEGFKIADKASSDKLYRPLTLAHFAIEKQLWGDSPKVAHAFNLFYYSLCCLLLFVFLKILFPAVFLYSGGLLAALIALLFAAHPVHTEVVANIKSRDEILCLLFLLAALLSLVRYVQTTHWGFLAALLFAYTFSLFSKENAITFVALAPLTIYFTQKSTDKKIWTMTIPAIVLLTGIYLVIRSSVLGSITNRELDIMDNSLMAATSFGEMLATNFMILWEYLLLLFYPHPLSWDYSYNQISITGFSNPLAIFSFILHVLLLAYALFSLRKKNWIAYGILFYFITLSISSNLIIKIASTMAERFLFLPSVGFCIAVAISAEKIFQKISKPALKNALLILLFLSLTAAYSYKTIHQNRVWKDPLTLLQAGVIASPNSARTHLFLGHEYLAASVQKSDRIKQTMDIRKAINCYLRSIEIYPQYGGALNSLGSAYHSLGMPDSALFFLQKISKQDKEFPKACYNLGDVWFSLRNADSALHYFLKVPPDDISYGLANNSIGFIYAQQNRTGEAIERLKLVRAADPAFGKACNNIGKLYLNLALPDSALRYFLLVPQTEPAYANAQLQAGNIFLQQGKYAEALLAFGKIKPHDGGAYRDALFLSGKSAFEQGNVQSALSFFEKSITVDPAFKPAYEALSKVFEMLGNKASAEYYAQKAATL